MIQAANLVKGQTLRIHLDQVQDRLPTNLYNQLELDPYGKWMGGYKMVDGNAFGLVLELGDGSTSWFFEDELSEIAEDYPKD